MSVMKTAILSNGAPCMLEAAVKSAGIGGLRAPRQARLPVIGQRLADRLPLELVRGRLVLEEGDDCGDLFRRKSGESLPSGIKQGELSIPPRIDRRVPCLIRKWGGEAASHSHVFELPLQVGNEEGWQEIPERFVGKEAQSGSVAGGGPVEKGGL